MAKKHSPKLFLPFERHNSRFGRYPITIDGEQFLRFKMVWLTALERGFTGTQDSLQHRIRAGKRTWAQLFAPPSTSKADATRARHQKTRDEMQALIASIDERKKALPK